MPEVTPIRGGSLNEAELSVVADVRYRETRERSESPLAQALRRLRRNKTALLGAGIAVALITAFAFVVINVIVDLTYTVLDPRIRYA